jgi:hypothetical protein
VQDRANASPGEAQAPLDAFDERVLIQRTPHGHARLVDALDLYAPEADASDPHVDKPPLVDADRAQGASVAAGGPSLPPEIASAAQHVLARRLGPVAGVLVKRAADTSGGSHHAFVDHLIAALPVAHQQAGLRAELEALLQPPQRTEPGR